MFTTSISSFACARSKKGFFLVSSLVLLLMHILVFLELFFLPLVIPLIFFSFSGIFMVSFFYALSIHSCSSWLHSCSLFFTILHSMPKSLTHIAFDRPSCILDLNLGFLLTRENKLNVVKELFINLHLHINVGKFYLYPLLRDKV